MNSDNINPMTELERLFEQRGRTITLIAEQNTKIFQLENRLNMERECLEQNKKAIGITEDRIREMAKKL